MKYLKQIFFTVCAFWASCGFVCAQKENSVKFAFLAPTYETPSMSAAFNGARDAAKELRARFGKSMTMEFHSAQNSAPKQTKQLANLYLEGYKGAIVYPVDGAQKDIAASAAALAERGFYVAIVGEKIELPALAACVFTDTQKTAEMLSEQIKKLSEGKKTSLLCYFYDKSERKILDFTEQKLISKYIYPNLTFKEFMSVIEPLAPMKMLAMEYYWEYAKQNAIEIQRYDNFGEIFFSPLLLADATPIKKDLDRRFAICVGALPQFEFFLTNKMLDACIYDDFYGWGYVAARALMEKSFDANPDAFQTQYRKLNPILATPAGVKNFSADWRKWLK